MVTKKVDIYMAALFRHGFAVQSIRSLMLNPEFATATITCNSHSDAEWQYMVDEFENDDRVTLHRHDNEKGSNEKLRYIGTGSNEYICMADNDLLYPPDYLAKLIAGVDKYRAYCSLHGSILNKGRIGSYYRDRQTFRGLGTVLKDVEVDISSNCGSVFRRDFFGNDYLNTWYDFCDDVSADDLYCNYLAMKKGRRRMVLAHQENYLVHKEQLPDEVYVFDVYKFNDQPQTDFVNNFIKKYI